jgi:hypothetical protein
MRLSSRFAITLFALLAASAAGAVAQEPLPQTIVASSQPLSGAQEAQVQAYSEFWLNVLAVGDLDEMIDARDELVKSTRRAGVTSVFLQSFSTALLPQLSTIIDNGDSIRAENALRVAAFLRTPRSAELVAVQTHPQNASDPMRRLVASGLLSIAVADVRESGLNSAELATIAREISRALEVETNWHVVLQDLRALGAIATSRALNGANRGVVRELQFSSFENLVDRASEGTEPSPLMQGVYRAMLDLRMRMITSGSAASTESRELAGTLRRALSKIGAASIKQWTGLTESASARRAYEGTLRVGAQLLSLLDGSPDSRAAALAEAMERGKSDLQSALTRFSSR